MQLATMGAAAPLSTPSQDFRPRSGSENTRRENVAAIIKAVADEFGLSVAQLMTPSRSHAVWKPRMAAMYYARQMTGCSLPELGEFFGGRSHTTVLRAVRRCREMMDKDPVWTECMDGMLERLIRLVIMPDV